MDRLRRLERYQRLGQDHNKTTLASGRDINEGHPNDRVEAIASDSSLPSQTPRRTEGTNEAEGSLLMRTNVDTVRALPVQSIKHLIPQ